jgi:rhodanese-related sulfurtransferase
MQIPTSALGFDESYDPEAAARHFSRRLAHETDVSDVHSALASAERFTLVDVRSPQAWEAGHVPGAVLLPVGKIRARAARFVDPALPVVVYCWGPGCNGATRAALEFSRLGYRVKEMLGGFEYWVREGFPYRTGDGEEVTRPADPLTAPGPALDLCQTPPSGL